MPFIKFTRKIDKDGTVRLYLYDPNFNAYGIARAKQIVADEYGYIAEHLTLVNQRNTTLGWERYEMYSFKVKPTAKKKDPLVAKDKKVATPAFRKPVIRGHRPTEDDGVLYTSDLLSDPEKYIERRNSGKLEGYAAFLDDEYRWEIVIDDRDTQCLVAFKK